MTPAEKARAVLISDEITAKIRDRRTPAKTAQNSPLTDHRYRSKTPLYSAIAVFVAAIHITAFLAYRHYQTTKAERQAQHIQALADARADAAYAQAQADQLRAALAATNNAHKQATIQTQQKPPGTQWTHLRTITPQPATRTPRVEYNVYHEPRRTPQRQPRRTTVQQQPTPTPPKPDRTADHRQAAINYVMKQWGLGVKSCTTTAVPGWKGRYRTSGTAIIYVNNRNTPTPRKFELLTQEKDGTIIPSDLTRKW